MNMRKTVLSDLKALHKLFVDAAEYKHSFGDSSWREGFSEDGTKWMIDGGNTYVAEEVGTIIGTLCLNWSDDAWEDDGEQTAGYICRLAVAKDQHGKGVGKKLIEWAMQEVANNGCKHLRLDCDSANTSLCAYYERLGFELITQKEFKSDAPSGSTLSSLYQK